MRSGSAEDERRERHRVDAQVQEGTTGQVRVEQPTLRVTAEGLAVVGGHRHHLAQAAIGDQLPDDVVVRQEAAPHRLHRHHTRRRGRIQHLAGLRGGLGERLLDQDVLAGRDRQQGVVAMLGVRARHVHRLHHRVLDEFLVAAVGVPDTPPPGECRRRDLGCGSRPRPPAARCESSPRGRTRGRCRPARGCPSAAQAPTSDRRSGTRAGGRAAWARHSFGGRLARRCSPTVAVPGSPDANSALHLGRVARPARNLRPPGLNRLSTGCSSLRRGPQPSPGCPHSDQQSVSRASRSGPRHDTPTLDVGSRRISDP